MNHLFFLFFLSSVAFAGGVMSLTGQMISCDDSTCKIKVDQVQVYKINVAKLSLLQRRELQTKKRGDPVAMAVVMNSIVAVEDVKKESN